MNNLKIIEAEITNFKNISKRIVHLGGRSFTVTGKNASGKSSLIQAFMSPLDAKKVPPQPIKEGEERASIYLKIAGEINGKPREYKIDMIFTKSNLSGRLEIRNIEGEKVNVNKTALRELMGNISFDIFEFLRKKPKEQVEILKKLAGIDFNELDKQYQDLYEQRTFVNKQASSKESIINQTQIKRDEIEKYSEKIDTVEITKRLSEAYEKNQQITSIESGRKERSSSIERANTRINQLKEEISKIEAESQKASEEISKADGWLQKNQKIDTNLLSIKLNEANDHNAKYDSIQKTSELYKEVRAHKEEGMKLTKKLEEITEKKAQMIRKSTLPIEGLSFSDDQVLYNGLPMEESQINKAKLIDIGARIAMAMNPNLRVVIVNDGSLMDKETEDQLTNLLTANGYQFIVEKVTENEEVDIHFKEQEV